MRNFMALPPEDEVWIVPDPHGVSRDLRRAATHFTAMRLCRRVATRDRHSTRRAMNRFPGRRVA